MTPDASAIGLNIRLTRQEPRFDAVLSLHERLAAISSLALHLLYSLVNPAIGSETGAYIL